MDTRRKILSLQEAAALPRPVLLVTGYFDVLRAGHLRDLDNARRRAADARLLAAVLPLPDELLSQPARAELVAALRVVDYVVIADPADVERLAALLQPVDTVRLEAADLRRARELKEHVHRRQS